MKKLFFAFLWIILCVFIFSLGYIYRGSQIHRKEAFLDELIIGWSEFESAYKKDIKNIDALRDELRSLRQERDGWEKIAFEFKDEALDYKMKYKEVYNWGI